MEENERKSKLSKKLCAKQYISYIRTVTKRFASDWSLYIYHKQSPSIQIAATSSPVVAS